MIQTIPRASALPAGSRGRRGDHRVDDRRGRGSHRRRRRDRSGAALAFGVDSIIELGSAGCWYGGCGRRSATRSPERIEAIERRAGRIVGGALFAFTGYVVIQSLVSLALHVEPEPSLLGIALAVVATVGMPVLARVKRKVAKEIGSSALKGDAACGITCAYMAATLLGGLALNALFGWWWADPIAALGIVYFLVREGREAWNGDCCADDCCATERSVPHE